MTAERSKLAYDRYLELRAIFEFKNEMELPIPTDLYMEFHSILEKHRLFIHSMLYLNSIVSKN
jgi:hypothetical protein